MMLQDLALSDPGSAESAPPQPLTAETETEHLSTTIVLKCTAGCRHRTHGSSWCRASMPATTAPQLRSTFMVRSDLRRMSVLVSGTEGQADLACVQGASHLTATTFQV